VLCCAVVQELRLNRLEPEKLLSPTDVSLNTVRNVAQGAAAAGLLALAYFAGVCVSKYALRTCKQQFALEEPAIVCVWGGVGGNARVVVGCFRCCTGATRREWRSLAVEEHGIKKSQECPYKLYGRLFGMCSWRAVAEY